MSIIQTSLDVLFGGPLELLRTYRQEKRRKANYKNVNNTDPLPVPKWSRSSSKSFKLKSQSDFDILMEKLQAELSCSLEDLRYDIVENTLQFYRHYKREKHGTFLQKYKSYNPTLPPDNHDCIGLVLELRKAFKKLDAIFPNISKYFFVASCQENLENISKYTQCLAEILTFKHPELDELKLKEFDKEHVVLCLKFELQFIRRNGTIIFDPGFHVGKVVVVMEDGLAPHTGWFVQKEDYNNNLTKMYEYSYSKENKEFINWHEKTTKIGEEINVINVIYIGRPFENYLEVTEKRNLVYFFKSLLTRDKLGHVIAGIYFRIENDNEEFSILYQMDKQKHRIKVNFQEIREDQTKIKKSLLSHLQLCSEQLKMSLDKLLGILLEVKEMVNDKVFVKGLLEIEDYITEEISGLWSIEDPEHVYSP